MYMIKRTLLVCIFSLLLVGCSEGDIINDDFSFTAALDNCFNGDDFVFFKVDPNVDQAFSLNFTSTTFELNTVPEALTFSITLNGTSNALIYRKFDTAIDGQAYFCTSVPPGNILVTQELIASNGTVTINYVEKEQTTTEITYTRTITITNVTLLGDDIEVRQEVIEFGSDEITVPK